MTACSPAPPVVVTRNTLPVAAHYAVSGDTPAATEVRRQLEARGLYAADAATTIRPGFAAAPRRLAACTAIDPATSSCTDWLDPPQPGFAPFAPPLRYRLTLDLDGSQVIVTRAGGGKDAPLPSMVTAALDRLTAR